MDWKERRFINEVYMKQEVKIKIGQETTGEIGVGRGLDSDVICRLLCLIYI